MTRALPGQRKLSRSKYDLTEGMMPWAEDKRPKATLHTGVGYYALQLQARIRYELTLYVPGCHSISWPLIKSMVQRKQPSR